MRLQTTTWILLPAAVVLLLAAVQLGGPLSAETSSMHSRVLDKLLDAGETAENRDDWQAAEENYRQAIALFPRHAVAWSHYGEFQRFYRHNEAEATKAFERALHCTIPDPMAEAYAWRGLGEMAENRNDTQRALELFQKSLRCMSLGDTHRSLSHLYGRMNRMDDAARHAQLAAESDPNDPIGLLLYAGQLERFGKHAQARQIFNKALAIADCKPDGSHTHPVHCCVLYNSAGYYAIKGDNSGALKMLEAFFKTPNHRHLSREHVLDDPDFVELKKDPEFMKLLDEFLPATTAQAH